MSKLTQPILPIVLSTHPLVVSLPFLLNRLDPEWHRQFIDMCWGRVGVVRHKGLVLFRADQPTKLLGFLIHLEVCPNRDVPLRGTVLTTGAFPNITETSLGLRPVCTFVKRESGPTLTKINVLLEDM